MFHKINKWKQIEVKYDKDTDTYKVYIHTPFYISKIRELSHCYSTSWKKSEILQDVIKYYL